MRVGVVSVAAKGNVIACVFFYDEGSIASNLHVDEICTRPLANVAAKEIVSRAILNLFGESANNMRVLACISMYLHVLATGPRG